MDGYRFDLIVKSLVASAPRRETIRALAGTGLAAIAATFSLDQAEANNDKKKRRRRRRKKKKKNQPQPCLQRRQPCDGSVKCCDEDAGLTACRTFPTATCATLSGRFCCGLEGAVCSNDVPINNCDCCDGLFCGGLPGQEGRCQEEPS